MSFVIEGGFNPMGKVHMGFGTVLGRFGPILACLRPFSVPGAKCGGDFGAQTDPRLMVLHWGTHPPSFGTVWTVTLKILKLGPHVGPLLAACLPLSPGVPRSM